MIQTRDAIAEDLALVRDAWIRSNARSKYSGTLCNDFVFAAYISTVDRILRHAGVKVLVAYLDEAPGVILGFLVWDASRTVPAIHYMFTKKDYRKSGVCHALLARAGITKTTPVDYTFRTYFSDQLIGRGYCGTWRRGIVGSEYGKESKSAKNEKSADRERLPDRARARDASRGLCA